MLAQNPQARNPEQRGQYIVSQAPHRNVWLARLYSSKQAAYDEGEPDGNYAQIQELAWPIYDHRTGEAKGSRTVWLRVDLADDFFPSTASPEQIGKATNYARTFFITLRKEPDLYIPIL